MEDDGRVGMPEDMSMWATVLRSEGCTEWGEGWKAETEGPRFQTWYKVVGIEALRRRVRSMDMAAPLMRTAEVFTS